MTVGSLEFDVEKKRWVVKCRGDVMIKLKRVLTKIDQSNFGFALLSDTDENARDLAWFMERFTFSMDEPTRRRLQARSDAHKVAEMKVSAILTGMTEPLPGRELALPARDYQRKAAELCQHNGFLLLGDQVGLGKSCSAICVLAGNNRLPALVVTMTSITRQWKKEIERFLPGTKVCILPTGKFDAKLLKDRPEVLVCNYHKLAGWADGLQSYGLQTLILDEGQELRHEDTARYRAATYLARASRLVMITSATPIFNYGGEIYNVMNLLREGLLGDRREFARQWCGGSSTTKACIQNATAFGTYIRSQGYMLARTRMDVGRELPDLTVVPYEIDCDKHVFDQATGGAMELAKILLSVDPTKRHQKFQAGGEFDAMMRQATGLAKAAFVADFVRMLVEAGEKVVLFGWHRAVYAIWNEKLADLKPAMFTGSESPAMKALEVERFVSGKTPVIILSLRAGAGLDGLQFVSRTVVIGELDWAHGVIVQDIGRVHRDGQKDKVVAYMLLSETGADPIMADVLGVKRGQLEGIMDPDAEPVTAGLDPDHIMNLARDFVKRRGGLDDGN